ncbi:biotin transport system substrate-specific component [Sanguibacter gelidistatuariae]|uniref:Biotin transporter n=1 Tax=Sanguibacter gelidistatuariae TaxID=1814289 RepID=A0A1G6TQ04_9MICO|nr:biotin transporter BioY [Sanguibacter gelidistatuariae]SDD31262.1 biotin transport system substrate-specific component [Sanguibacter gelidistatuariae]
MSDAPAAQSPAVRRNLVRDSAATDVALIATFAALITACALLPAITIAVVPVPITLQTFAVLLTGAVLGPRRALLTLGLYLAIGMAGVPVFSMGRTGLAVLAGPSAGYVVAFPIAAALVGVLVGRIPARAGRTARVALTFAACAAATALVIYPLGIAGMAWRLDLTAAEAFVANAAYIPGDLVKCTAAAVTATAVLRAFPRLQRRA